MTIPFPKVWALCEMQTAPSWSWTQVTVPIYYNDNHYTTSTSYIYIYIYVCVCVCWYIYIYIYIYVFKKCDKWASIALQQSIPTVNRFVSWNCREVRTPLNECPGHDNKLHLMVRLQSWRFGGMWNTPSLPLLPGPIRSGVVAPVRVPSLGQIELFNHLLKSIIISYLKPNSSVQLIYIA